MTENTNATMIRKILFILIAIFAVGALYELLEKPTPTTHRESPVPTPQINPVLQFIMKHFKPSEDSTSGLFAVYKPVKIYDWNTFQENSKLSEDYSKAFFHLLDSSKNPVPVESWRMTSELRKEISDRKFFQKMKSLNYLNVREVRIQALKRQVGSARSSIGYEVIQTDGRSLKFDNSAVFHDSYRFAFVAIFNDDHSLTIKTNGEELYYNYATDKEQLAKAFLNQIYWMFRHLYKSTPEHQQEEAQENAAKEQKDRERLSENEKSWNDPSYKPPMSDVDKMREDMLSKLEKPKEIVLPPEMIEMQKEREDTTIMPKPIIEKLTVNHWTIGSDGKWSKARIQYKLQNGEFAGGLAVWIKNANGQYRENTGGCITYQSYTEDEQQYTKNPYLPKEMKHTFWVENIPANGVTVELYHMSKKDCFEKARPENKPSASVIAKPTQTNF